MSNGQADLQPVVQEIEQGVAVNIGADNEHEPTLAEDLGLLVEQAKVYAQAEFAFQKSRAAYAAAETRNIALLCIGAAVLAFFAVMALVVGSLIALAPLLGGWGATAVVTLTLLLAVFLCALGARSRTRRLLDVVSDSGEDA